MSFRPIYEGWHLRGKLSRNIKKNFSGIGLNRDLHAATVVAERIRQKLESQELDTGAGQHAFAEIVAEAVIHQLGGDPDDNRFADHLADVMASVIAYEGWFELPDFASEPELTRGELWQIEDALGRVEAISDHLDEVADLAAGMLGTLLEPLIRQHPHIIEAKPHQPGNVLFEANLRDMLDVAETVEHILAVPFAPELDALALTPRLRARLEYNLQIASGGVPGGSDSVRTPKLPTKQSSVPADRISAAYLGDTPLLSLLDYPLTIELPQATRFEHMHIIAGSGHGKTQTLQHLILHDLEAVAAGEASIVVIDSQSDLIDTIAGLEVFAPGGPLADRLVLIDPTDLEWPVALNLFDAGLERLDQYSLLDRERLTNSILELYDFVLGSLLDAGMTQKQTIIFRYITRLLLRIPDATIHTLRELLEDGGSARYRQHIGKLTGSARAFFDNEFDGKEFVTTKRQVLRRLYGILENQTFERMFTHPKSKLDLFTEMNAGKVILINTAKDLLKENGTEIFGRFFIAMIAQAAQERAVLAAGRAPANLRLYRRGIGLFRPQCRHHPQPGTQIQCRHGAGPPVPRPARREAARSDRRQYGDQVCRRRFCQGRTRARQRSAHRCWLHRTPAEALICRLHQGRDRAGRVASGRTGANGAAAADVG